MKVCFLTSNFPPEIHAGTELVVVALGQALLRRGVEVVTITTSDVVHSGQDLRHEEFAGIRVLRVYKRADEWDANGLNRPRLANIVEHLLQVERPDVLHAHSLSGFGGRLLQQAVESGLPTVLTLHDAWVTCPRYFRLPPPGHSCPPDASRVPCVPCINATLQHADLQAVRHALQSRDAEVRAEVAAACVLTAPSRTMAAIVRRHLPCFRPIEVVPHGLLQQVPAGQRAAAPLPGETVRIGTFGSLVEQKGVRELVAAAAGLPCELHLAGPFLAETFAAEVRALASRSGVPLSCHGPYAPGGPHPARRLHLAVFPSRCQESYGLVVDEALAHGVPVVVSDQGAFAERTGQGGVRVSRLSDLHEVLRELVTDAEALSALRAAVPAVLPSIDLAAARYLELYGRAREALSPT